SDILPTYVAVVFVDWDNNGTFDPTEQITTNLQGTSVFTFNITSPLTATPGLKRMRIRMGQNTVPAACGSIARGDTEDYTINLTNAAIPAPANDLCANATVLTPTSSCSNTGGTTLGATQSFAPGTCGTGVANDVWYTFTANGLSEYEIRATGTGAGTNLFDPIIGLYTSCNATGFVSCINATGPNGSEVISPGVLPAGTYYYRIYSSGGAVGNFTTCVVDITPQPSNECDNPLTLTNVNNNCSANQRYNNFGATPSGFGPPACWGAVGTDVWFKFVAVAGNVRIDVFGLGQNSNTLEQPQIALYSGACAAVLLTEGCASTVPGSNTSFLSVGGLTVGTEYLIRVSSANSNQGTFQFCIDNFTPPVLPGQDCGTARVLCTKDPIVETDITGFGADGFEAANSCLAAGVSTGAVTEQNSTWYTWTAANNGTLGFDIIPAASTPNLDIDFVLYQMDPVNGCVGRTALRCMAASCVGPTGLNATSADLNEIFDCDPAIQDNYVLQLDMIAGQRYGLLVNNFQNGGSGYTINFNGTGTFLGPQPAFDVVANDPCVLPQTVTITSTSVDVDTYLWNFGSGANPATANTAGPHTVTYSTSGTKTVSLTVTGAGGCDSLLQIQYEVAQPLAATSTVINAICDQPNGSITVNSTGGNGSAGDLEYAINGGTPQSSNQFTNLSPGTYAVSVIDTSNCTFDFNVTVGNTPTPVINPIANVVACDEYILPAIAGTNLTGNESYYTATNGGGINYLPGQIVTDEITLFAYDATTTTPVCSDEEMFTITVNEAPGFQNVTRVCNPGNADYVVSFEVIDGDPASYAVNVVAPAMVTGTFSGTTWTSSVIPSGTTYIFEITDGNGCTPTQVTGVRDCNCTTDAGTMNSAQINLCGPGVITATHVAGSFQNDGDDVLRYVLHTNNGPNLGTVLGTNTTPSFSFGGTMTYGTIYYISAIAGNSDGMGGVNQADPCFSVASGTPVRWRELPTADFSGSASICNGQSTPLTFTLTGSSPFSVTYNNGSGNQTVTNLSDQGTQVVSPTITRNYTLISVTGVNGCSGTVAPTVLTVTVNNPPVVSAPTYICNANNDGYAVQFTISDGNGGPYLVTPISPAGPTVSVASVYTSNDVPSGTAFTFQVDDANGCGPVMVTGTHSCACSSSSGLMSQTPIQACETQTISPAHNQATMVLDNNDVLTYVLHDVSGGTLGTILATNNTNSTFGFQAGMTYGTTYYISATVGNNDGTGTVDFADPCLSVASGTPVVWYLTPTSTAGAVTNPVCAGQPLELTSTNTTAAHSWTHSNSIYTTTNRNPTRNPATTSMSGIYTLTVSANGCSSTSSVNVTVNPVQNATINNAPAGPFCSEDGTVQFTAVTPGGTWSGPGITNPAQGLFSTQTAGVGTHTITYSFGGTCPSSSTKTVVVNESPVFDFAADVVEGCSPLTVNFTNTYPGADIYAWDFGDASAINNTESPSHEYNAGNFDVTLSITRNGCTTVENKNFYILVHQTPQADFAFMTDDQEGSVVFENLSTGGVSYTWSFGDGQGSTEFSPQHQYGAQGTYDVSLEVVGAGGCMNSITIPVTVNTGATVYIPNAFTPNGDSENQYFMPVLGGDIDFSTYKMQIFNRWGELLFESKDPNIGWDGTFKNKACKVGVYSYKVYFKNSSTDKKNEIKGAVNLIK
ncbi:MAG: gliding motility-associated C-terminal domain-containing protein, partial [Bacteroidetes bacterium]|nr:gliding motility-associated C-terminal domain-containing protein [Bacteroidota bacterium]